MRVLTYNVAALEPFLKEMTARYDGLGGFLKRHRIDIFCVQEAKIFAPTARHASAGGADYESFWSVCTAPGKKGYSGVTTFVHARFSPVAADAAPLRSARFDAEGRTLVTYHGAFAVVNVYVPNAGDRAEGARLAYKLEFLDALGGLLRALAARGLRVILAGDLNVAAAPRDVYRALRAEPWHGYSEAELEWMRANVGVPPAPAEGADGGGGGGSGGGGGGGGARAPLLVDAWRAAHPEADTVYTVFDISTRAEERNEGTRIDAIAVDARSFAELCGGAGARARAGAARIDLAEAERADLPAGTAAVVAAPPSWSDHRPILLVMDDPPLPPPHAPCAASSRVRFKSIAAFFTQKAGGGGGAGGAAGGAAGGGGGGGGEAAPGGGEAAPGGGGGEAEPGAGAGAAAPPARPAAGPPAPAHAPPAAPPPAGAKAPRRDDAPRDAGAPKKRSVVHG